MHNRFNLHRLMLTVLVLLLGGCVSETSSFNKQINYEEAARTRISLGLTYLRNGNYTQAKINLDKALEFSPRLADAHYSLGYYFQVVGENARAEEYFENAMKIAPRNPDIANTFGAFLCQQGRYKEATVYFNRAVGSKRYANSAQTYENMAICADKEGFTDEAIEHLLSALNHQPGRTKTLVLLTELYVKKGDYKKADEALDRVERLGKIDADLLWLRMDVAKRNGDVTKAKQYGDMLLSVYPDSALAKQYANQPVAAARQASKSIKGQAGPVSAGDLPMQHTVAQGENLFRISVQYNIAMRRLIEWNNLDESGAIQLGMTLWLIPPEARERN